MQCSLFFELGELALSLGIFKMEKTCPRCKKEFECKPENIFSCRCSDVYIPPRLSEQIGNLYSDCICDNCMEEMLDEFYRSEANK